MVGENTAGCIANIIFVGDILAVQEMIKVAYILNHVNNGMRFSLLSVVEVSHYSFGTKL